MLISLCKFPSLFVCGLKLANVRGYSYVVYGRKPRVGEKVVVKKETTVPVSSELASKENPSPPVTKPEKDKETTIQQPITDTSIPIVGDEPVIIEKPLDNNDENPVETKPTAEKTVAEEKDPLKGLTTEEKWAYITVTSPLPPLPSPTNTPTTDRTSLPPIQTSKRTTHKRYPH